jgi:hypothetical protein
MDFFKPAFTSHVSLLYTFIPSDILLSATSYCQDYMTLRRAFNSSNVAII